MPCVVFGEFLPSSSSSVIRIETVRPLGVDVSQTHKPPCALRTYWNRMKEMSRGGMKMKCNMSDDRTGDSRVPMCLPCLSSKEEREPVETAYIVSFKLQSNGQLPSPPPPISNSVPLFGS